MHIDPKLLKDFWSAFPAGYFDVPGTVTVGGQQVLKGKNGQVLWYWPQDALFSRPGLTLFDDARPTATLLPDLEDDSTWAAVMRLLAQRTGLGTRGTTWVPKTHEVRDRSRGSTSKAIAGWTLHSMTRQATFPLPDVKGEDVALLRAVAMTNCACGRGSQRDCPQHGDVKARPWR